MSLELQSKVLHIFGACKSSLSHRKPATKPLVNPGSALANCLDLFFSLGLDVEKLELALKDNFVETLGPKLKDNGKPANGLTQGNDMLNLSDLTKDKLLENLESRYEREVIYTYVGDIVLSVNPFKRTGADGKLIRELYKGAAAKDLPPHPYGLVDRAYRKMVGAVSGEGPGNAKLSQSILISGESGAGKTEATKVCLAHICDLSASAGEVAAKLMQTNPVMEALGNAKTVRNSNSSRFGKHFDVQFDRAGTVVGAFTTAYLLEKPRICAHAVGERNYHIFYMLSKAPSELREPLGLAGWEDYCFLKMEGTAADARPSWDDAKEFTLTHNALLAVGFTPETRSDLYSVYALILQLGNLTFTPTGAVDEGCTVGPEPVLEQCAKLLRVECETLRRVLTLKSIVIMGETTLKPLNKNAASEVRNALATQLYMLAFNWCVTQMNEYVSRPDLAAAGIAILDIFGFENFAVNGFSQLCINYTNESLQSLFIQHVFKLEQEEYASEGIAYEAVAYQDNQPVIDLIAKRPMCLLSKLDESSQLASGTDRNTLDTLHREFGGAGSYKPYTKPRKSSDRNFVISHYAGDVTYTIFGFVDANRGDLPDDISDLLVNHCQFAKLSALMKAEIEEAAGAAKGGRKPKKKTVSMAFGASLALLMTRLNATEHHYIRCLKPNQTLKSGEWDPKFMVSQLGYSGTLEVAQVRAAGCPNRIDMVTFLSYYGLGTEGWDKNDPPAESCKKVVEGLQISEALYKLGKTKIFLKEAAMEPLAAERRRIEKENANFYKKLMDFQILMKVCMVRKRKRREKAEAEAKAEAERLEAARLEEERIAAEKEAAAAAAAAAAEKAEKAAAEEEAAAASARASQASAYAEKTRKSSVSQQSAAAAAAARAAAAPSLYSPGDVSATKPVQATLYKAMVARPMPTIPGSSKADRGGGYATNLSAAEAGYGSRVREPLLPYGLSGVEALSQRNPADYEGGWLQRFYAMEPLVTCWAFWTPCIPTSQLHELNVTRKKTCRTTFSLFALLIGLALLFFVAACAVVDRAHSNASTGLYIVAASLGGYGLLKLYVLLIHARYETRRKYKIPGNLCLDILASVFCTSCAATQMLAQEGISGANYALDDSYLSSIPALPDSAAPPPKPTLMGGSAVGSSAAYGGEANRS